MINIQVRAPVCSRYLRAADFGDNLPGFVKDRQPLGFRRVGTNQTATQRPKQQVLERRRQQSFFINTFTFTGSPRHNHSRPLTLGKPASSQSLIMPMKSVALAATNSGLNALMTEFNSKALWETRTSLQSKRHSLFRVHPNPIHKHLVTPEIYLTLETTALHNRINCNILISHKLNSQHIF